MKINYFSILLVIIILIRLILLTQPSFKIDMTDWQAWTARLIDVGPTHFYSPDYFADYFPGYLYLLGIVGSLVKNIYPNFSFFTDSFGIILKLLTNLFDLGTAFLIYKIILQTSLKWAKIASLFYLTNPALIFNSSVWGQIDGTLTFFLVLSIYQLTKLKPSKSTLTESLAILIKPQALAILPINLIFLLRNFKIRQSILALLILIAAPLILSIPFFLSDPIWGLFKLFEKTANGYTYTSLYAFNFWAIVGWWQPDNTIKFLFSYQIWGFILYAIAIIFIILPIIKSKETSFKLIYFSAALSLFAFYLFPTRVHDRYLFPFFAFLIITTSQLKNIKMISIYILLSIIHLSNLWYVYFYYNTIYNNPSYSGSALYDAIGRLYPLFSVVTLISFVILLIYYYVPKPKS